jgi:hypothetical protein
MQNRKTATNISKTKLKKFIIKRSLFVKMNLIDLLQNQNGKSMSNLKIPAKELLVLLKKTLEINQKNNDSWLKLDFKKHKNP